MDRSEDERGKVEQKMEKLDVTRGTVKCLSRGGGCTAENRIMYYSMLTSV